MAFYVEMSCIFPSVGQKRGCDHSPHRRGRNVYTLLLANLLVSKYIESLQDLIGVLNHVTGKVEKYEFPILHFIRIIRRYCFKQFPSLSQ